MYGERTIENAFRHARFELNKEFPKSGVNEQSQGNIKKTFPSTVLGHFGLREALEEKDCQAEETINKFSFVS